jgi:hypothetical protein
MKGFILTLATALAATTVTMAQQAAFDRLPADQLDVLP